METLESSSSSPSAPSSLCDKGLLAFMGALPQDILGKVVFDVLSISDEKRLWEEDSTFRTVYTWCMATHRESGLRRRKEGAWPLIRSTVAVFSQDDFDWTDRLSSFRRKQNRSAQPGHRGGAVRDEWDIVKHEDIVLKHLCETGAVACDTFTLFAAVDAGYISTVRYLVEERGVDPAANGNYALSSAAWNGHTDVVQFLLDLPTERGVDPAAHNNFAFRWAARDGHTAIVQLLLDLPIGRRPNFAVVQYVLSNRNLCPAMASILAEHHAKAEPAPKRRKV